MPFSDIDGYETGHFTRVYEHLIRPACLQAGVTPLRGDEVKATNYIAVDVLQRVLESDIVVCDLSGKNPNVMYELGLRQAFDRPVVLLKDMRTERVFDIQGLRTLDYSESLRIDSVERDRLALKDSILATMQLENHEINSLIRVLGVQKAILGQPTQVSPEASLMLNALKEISSRISALEDAGKPRTAIGRSVLTPKGFRRLNSDTAHLPGGAILNVGGPVFDNSTGKYVELGILQAIGQDGLLIQPQDSPPYVLPPDDPRFNTLTNVPF